MTSKSDLPDWYLAPARWLATRTTAEERRAHGFWLGSIFVLLTALSWASVEHEIAIHVLQLINLALLCWTIVTTETPVETEDK